jgi:hypothetical protein
VKLAIYIVHWPRKDVRACEDHATKLMSLASSMGFAVNLEPCLEDVSCKNCENEEKAAEILKATLERIEFIGKKGPPSDAREFMRTSKHEKPSEGTNT